MNPAVMFSLVRSAMKIGGTALGVHAAYNGGDTITIALGVAAPAVAVIWSWLVHAQSN